MRRSLRFYYYISGHRATHSIYRRRSNSRRSILIIRFTYDQAGPRTETGGCCLENRKDKFSAPTDARFSFLNVENFGPDKLAICNFKLPPVSGQLAGKTYYSAAACFILRLRNLCTRVCVCVCCIQLSFYIICIKHNVYTKGDYRIITRTTCIKNCCGDDVKNATIFI